MKNSSPKPVKRWGVKHNKRFYKDLVCVPSPIREKIEDIAFGEEIKKDPLKLGIIEKLTGYKRYYKITFGDYRVGLKIDKKTKVIEFRRALHRKDIYRKFL